MFNEKYEAEAYDITCRVCNDWQFENISPTLAAMHLMAHSEFHSTKELGGPWWAMRVKKGYRGLTKERANLTPADGWNRTPTFEGPA